MGSPPAAITMSRGRRLDLSSPDYYQDMLTGIAQEILNELSELEKIDLTSLGEDAFDQVVGITQIRLLNELYYCLGQLRARGGTGGQKGHPGLERHLEPVHRRHPPPRSPEIPGGPGGDPGAVRSCGGRARDLRSPPSPHTPLPTPFKLAGEGGAFRPRLPQNLGLGVGGGWGTATLAPSPNITKPTIRPSGSAGRCLGASPGGCPVHFPGG